MIVLYILLAIIILFIIVLSVKMRIHVEYEETVTAYAKWAFLKIPLFPRPEKEPKPKKEKPKEDAPKEEAPKEPKPKGPNPFAVFYENEKLQGVLDLLKRLLALIDKFGRRFLNSFVIDEMFLDVLVSGKDAADTAEKYGKTCQKVFPVTGAICANCKVVKYSVNVEPDYLGNGYNEFAFSLEISLIPRKLINAVLLFAFGAVFKVGIKFLKGIKPQKNGENNQNTNDTNNDNNAQTEGFPVDADTPMPIKQTVYGKYQEGTVKEPDIYVENNETKNTESGA